MDLLKTNKEFNYMGKILIFSCVVTESNYPCHEKTVDRMIGYSTYAFITPWFITL